LQTDELSAISAWRRIVEHYPDEPELRFLYAQALDTLHRPDMSCRQWAIGLEKLLDQPDIERAFTPVGMQRNEVFVYSANKIIRNILYFKRKIQDTRHPAGAADELKKEHKTMAYLREQLGDRIAQSLGVFTCKHTEYLLVKTAGAHTLDSLLDTMPARKRKRTLVQAAELLADIHLTGSAGLRDDGPMHDVIAAHDPSYYLRRSGTACISALKHDQRVILAPQTLPRIMTALTDLTCSLGEVPRHFYKDHSPQNIIMSDLDELVCIDFEARREHACMLDMITLLEFGRAYVDMEDKETIIQAYFAERKKYTANQPDQCDTMRWYHLCGIQRHLEILGYRVRASQHTTPQPAHSPITVINYHLDQARTHAEVFARSYSTESEERSARQLSHALSEIKILVD
ncbi:phosphotransferase, partial [Candidatus Woesearchaeota archaeon]|nr:phosphotransferase [Candidatus Woesearchaeota archaeon]